MQASLLKLVVSAFMLLFPVSPLLIGASPPDIIWIRYANCTDPAYPDPWMDLRDLVMDASGSVYAVCDLNWDMGPTAPWHGAVFIAKWDREGAFQWSYVYADPDEFNHPVGAAVDLLGNIYVVGLRWPSEATRSDWFTMKIGPDGNLLGTMISNDTTTVVYYSVAVDVDSHLVLAGHHSSRDLRMSKLNWETETFEWDAYTSISPSAQARAPCAPGALDPGSYFLTGKNIGANEPTVTVRGMTLHGDAFWFIEAGIPARLHKVDCLDGTVVLTLDAPCANPTDLSWDGASLWCADSAGVMYRLNATDGAVQSSFDTGLENLYALHWDGELFWAIGNTDEIYTIDVEASEVVYQFDSPEGKTSRGICVRDESVWASHTTDNNIVRVDKQTGAWLGEYPPPGVAPCGLEFDDDGQLWISTDGTDAIYETEVDHGDGYWGRLGILTALWPLGEANVENTVILSLDSLDGSHVDSLVCDFAPQEQPTAMAVDASGSFYVAIWHPQDASFTVAKLGIESRDLYLDWSNQFTLAGPFSFPTDIAVGSDGLVYVAGYVSARQNWGDSSENSHMFTLCCDGGGSELWRDIPDFGGSSWKEWGTGYGIAVGEDDRLYVGGTGEFNGQPWPSWARAAVVVAYARTVVDTPAIFRIGPVGDVFADGQLSASRLSTGAADVAEWICISAAVNPGDVLEYDPSLPGCCRVSHGSFSSLVAGVVSTQPGVILASQPGGGQTLMALSGIVPVKVTNEGGSIRPGDLLVTSSTPGHAMRWADPDQCTCSLVGKALESMTGESGVILVLLMAY